MNGYRSSDPAVCAGPPPGRLSTLAVTLLGCLPAIVSFLWPAATDWMTSDRARIESGEVWRLATGHWTHWTLDHLRWDLLAFATLLPLCFRIRPDRVMAVLAASVVLIPVTVGIAMPGIHEYRGLSGLDSALFVLLAVSHLRQEITARAWGYVGLFGTALIAFVAKVGYELSAGLNVFVAGVDFIPVPIAHVMGGLCGWLGAAFDRSPFRVQFAQGSSRATRPTSHRR